jgi:hypothetical protein
VFGVEYPMPPGLAQFARMAPMLPHHYGIGLRVGRIVMKVKEHGQLNQPLTPLDKAGVRVRGAVN